MPTTPNMGMDLPDVSVTPGPTWASDLNTALTNQLDPHDHTSGKGVKIPSSGLNINATLPMNDNGLGETKFIEASNQTALFTGGSETNRVYASNAAGGRSELYYRDSSGSNVQITNGGSINVASAGGFGGDYVSASASATFTNATNTYTFNNGSSSRSNIDVRGIKSIGSMKLNATALAGNLVLSDTDDYYTILVDTSAARSITLPDPTLAKRVITIKDKTGTSPTNPITVVRFGSENIEGVAADYLLRGKKGSWTFMSDGTDWWVVDHTRAPDIAAYRSALNTAETISNGTFASLTLSATIVQNGVFARTSNVVKINDSGYYEAVISLSRLGASGTGKYVIARVQNTTAGTTSAFSMSSPCSASAGADGEDPMPTFVLPFEVTEAEVGNDFEFQCAANASSVAANSGNSVAGQDAPYFTVRIKREPGIY